MPPPLTCHRYYFGSSDLPAERSFEWAEIVLCSSGFFGAVSDYGNYAYAWRGFGSDFRRFIAKTNPDYVLGKIAPKEVYDSAATLEKVKRRICELRRQKALTSEEAREEWERVETYDNLWSEHDFAQWYQASAVPFPESDIACYRPDPMAKNFVTLILPRLQEAIRAEIAREEQATTARPCECT